MSYDQCVFCRIGEVCPISVSDFWADTECPFYDGIKLSKDNKEEKCNQ
jgi:hypothetical protein